MDQKSVDPRVVTLTNLSLWQAMFLVKGQPHLRRGIPMLLRNRVATGILVVQITIAIVVALRLAAFLQDPTVTVFAEWVASFGPLDRRQLFERLVQMVIDVGPLLFLLNLTWPVMAETLIYQRQRISDLVCITSPSTLWAGFMGLIPLRVIARYGWGVLPTWLTVRSADNAVVWAGKARLMQFYYAGYLATKINSQLPDGYFEQIIHGVLVRDGLAIWDALGSYVLIPVMVGVGAITLLVGISVVLDLPLANVVCSIASAPAGYWLVVLVVAAFVTSRAGLGALIFSAIGNPR